MRDTVTLLNVSTITVLNFQCFPKTRNEKIVSWQHVKFEIKTLIWKKMTKICRTEELLITVIQIWVFLAWSKVFRLHANLHKSSGTVKTTTNHGTGYCCILPQTPSSCLLGHITGLFCWISTKNCYPCIFQMLDCWSFFRKIIRKERMPLVAPDIECLEGKIVKELGIFKDWNVLGYSSLPSKDYKSTFKQLGKQKICTLWIGTMESSIILSWLPLYINIAQQNNVFCKKHLKNAKFHYSSYVRIWQILMIMVVRRLTTDWKTRMLIIIAATTRIDTTRLFIVQKRSLTYTGY